MFNRLMMTKALVALRGELISVFTSETDGCWGRLLQANPAFVELQCYDDETHQPLMKTIICVSQIHHVNYDSPELLKSQLEIAYALNHKESD